MTPQEAIVPLDEKEAATILFNLIQSEKQRNSRLPADWGTRCDTIMTQTRFERALPQDLQREMDAYAEQVLKDDPTRWGKDTPQSYAKAFESESWVCQKFARLISSRSQPQGAMTIFCINMGEVHKALRLGTGENVEKRESGR
jgi:hypothetical protein